MRFSDVLDIRNGRNQRQVENENGKYPIYGSGGIIGHADNFICDAETVVIGRKGSINNPIFVDEPFWNVDTAFGLVANKEVLLPKYLYYFCVNYNFEQLNTTVTIPSLTKANLLQIEIRVPDMDIQQNIVNVLDKICYLNDVCRKELYSLDQLVKSRFIELFGDPKDNPKGYSKKQLKETCRIITGNTPSRAVSEYYGDHIEWIKTDNIVSGLLNPTTATEGLSEKGMAVSRTVESGAILMACIAGSIASIGRVCVTDRKVAFNQQINAIVPSDYNILFLYVMLQISKEYLVDEINMALKGILSKSKLEEKTFYVPPMELQEQFAAFVTQVDKSKYYNFTSYKYCVLVAKLIRQEWMLCQTLSF